MFARRDVTPEKSRAQAIAGAVIICGLLFSVSPASAQRMIKVALGREFTLRKGQRAYFIGTNASIRIAGFINSPCPKGVRCVWSGQSVNLELTVAGATVPLSGSAPFEVEVIGSDYKTRASLRAARKLGGR